jgi:Tripartite tricarboxylate transporter TctB family
LTDETQGGSRAAGEPPDALSAEAGEPTGALSPRMARLDVAVAAALALVAATITVAMPKLIASGGIDTERDFATLSSALIPRLAFGFLTVLAIAVMLPAIARLKDGTGESPPDELNRLWRAGIAALIAIAYAASVTWLGYILATMLMTAAMAYYLGLRNPLAFVPGVVIIPILIRFVFERLLLISLPRSSIESVGVVEDEVLRYLAHIFLA